VGDVMWLVGAIVKPWPRAKAERKIADLNIGSQPLIKNWGRFVWSNDDNNWLENGVNATAG
jgi:hypothetical protein